MSAIIDTTKVAERRTLRFNSLADIQADVETLAKSRELKALGNWSPGQVVQHLALAMNKSIDGFSHRAPLPIRVIARLFFKRRFLSKTMSAGFQLPAKAAAELGPQAISLGDAKQNLDSAVARLQSETKREPHPALGELTAEEWNQLHCRHSELHLSFLIPIE